MTTEQRIERAMRNLRTFHQNPDAKYFLVSFEHRAEPVALHYNHALDAVRATYIAVVK